MIQNSVEVTTEQQQMEDMLQQRLQSARQGDFSEQSVTDIFEQAISQFS